MDMETTRLANRSWLSISDRQAVALRAAWWGGENGETRTRASNDTSLQPVPQLDWPSTLFADDVVCH